MNIKFVELERNEGQNQNTGKVWVAYRIVGTKIEDGSDWKSGMIFDNKYNRDLLDKARDVEEGEKINVKLEQDGKYWNPKDILDYVPEEGYKPMAGKASGGGKGDFKWQGRTGEAYDRSASIYLAFDVMKSTDGVPLDVMPVNDIMNTLYELADEIFEYINKGVAPVSGDNDAALEPPKV